MSVLYGQFRLDDAQIAAISVAHALLRAADMPETVMKQIAWEAYCMQALPTITRELHDTAWHLLQQQQQRATLQPAEAVQAALRAAQHEECAMPHLHRCLSCGGDLSTVRASMRPVFYALGRPGVRGTAYMKNCTT
jgi:hypothetical protein